ncbi:MAG: IMP cyclohydrolase [Bacillota bacterium]|nr:IMP cyclohydrolase [Bacillota bacterium]
MKACELTSLLLKNPYPGRGIMMGLTPDAGSALVAYFIMGRSENSQNRVFVSDGAALNIKAHDLSKIKDPSLIFYHPQLEHENSLILTNGDQTDTIYEGLKQGSSAEDALFTRCHEPDAPHFTPRISGVLDMVSGDFMLALLRASDEKGESCDRLFYHYPARPGFGRFIHTYEGDASPLPSFTGEPRAVTVPQDSEAFAKDIWNSLNPDFKVALFVREISLSDRTSKVFVYNRHQGGQSDA